MSTLGKRKGNTGRMSQPTLAIVISVKKEKAREELFKPIDSAGKEHIYQRSASKRVIDIPLFDKLQKKIDSSDKARISLVYLNEDQSINVVVADTKPMSQQYDEILRRLRFT